MTGKDEFVRLLDKHPELINDEWAKSILGDDYEYYRKLYTANKRPQLNRQNAKRLLILTTVIIGLWLAWKLLKSKAGFVLVGVLSLIIILALFHPPLYALFIIGGVLYVCWKLARGGLPEKKRQGRIINNKSNIRL